MLSSVFSIHIHINWNPWPSIVVVFMAVMSALCPRPSALFLLDATYIILPSPPFLIVGRSQSKAAVVGPNPVEGLGQLGGGSPLELPPIPGAQARPALQWFRGSTAPVVLKFDPSGPHTPS